MQNVYNACCAAQQAMIGVRPIHFGVFHICVRPSLSLVSFLTSGFLPGCSGRHEFRRSIVHLVVPLDVSAFFLRLSGSIFFFSGRLSGMFTGYFPSPPLRSPPSRPRLRPLSS